LLISYTNIKYSIQILKNYSKTDIRLVMKNYVEKNITEGSKILLEDRYNYSPFLLPDKIPVEYDSIYYVNRQRMKRKYFETLSKYGKARKFNITFLNIPLEGIRMKNYLFPDKKYLLENFDYIIICQEIRERFKSPIPEDNNILSKFLNSGYDFYYNILPQFEFFQLKNESGQYQFIYKLAQNSAL